MSKRIWKPEPQLTATVRLTDLAAERLTAWLAVQPLPPRSANEALNMALENLTPTPLTDDVAALRDRYRRLAADLDDIQTRLHAAGTTLEMLEATVKS